MHTAFGGVTWTKETTQKQNFNSILPQMGTKIHQQKYIHTIFIPLRTGKTDRLLWPQWQTYRVHYIWQIPCPDEELLAPEEGIRATELLHLALRYSPTKFILTDMIITLS